MIAAILPIVASLGVPSRWQKAVAWALAVLLAAIIAAALVWAFWHWVGKREDQAVQLDRADMTAEAANRVIEADRAADAKQMARDEQAAVNDKELSHEAVRNDGAAVRGVLERMREQQAAGRR